MKTPKGVGKHQILSKIKKIEKELKSLTMLMGKLEDDAPAVPDNTQEFIGFFCDQWKDHYKYAPKLDGKNIGALRNFLKSFHMERAKTMVVAYLKMKDPFFIKKRHDPATLLSNSMAVGHFADSGQFITASDASEMERTYKSQTLFDMVDQGKL